VDALLDLKQAVWIFRAGRWSELAGSGDIADGDRLLLAARSGEDEADLEAAFDAFAGIAAVTAPEGNRTPKWAGIREIAATARALAGLAYKPPDPHDRRMLLAHHGNLPPSEWKSGHWQMCDRMPRGAKV
jgi:hypothetical protein